jgi:hypothetical protein
MVALANLESLNGREWEAKGSIIGVCASTVKLLSCRNDIDIRNKEASIRN